MKNKHTKTIVQYTKNGVLYEHTFAAILGRSQIEQQMVMQLHVGVSSIGNHYYA